MFARSLLRGTSKTAALNDLANYRLFLTLSGPDASAFGEEAKARAAIGK